MSDQQQQLPANALELARRFVVAVTYRDVAMTRPHDEVTIEWRGGDTWCVMAFGECLRADGTGEYEPLPSSREDDFIKRTRFTLPEAFDVARNALPSIREYLGGRRLDSLIGEPDAN